MHIHKSGSSSGVEHQLPKLRVAGSNPVSRSDMKFNILREQLIYLVPLIGIIAIVYIIIRILWIYRQPSGNDDMKRIRKSIAQAALLFIRIEYAVLFIFILIIAVLLALKARTEYNSHWMIAVSFLVGSCCSIIAGLLSMKTATIANVRTTNAAGTSISKALKLAFNGGTAIGLSIAGFAILGFSAVFIYFYEVYIDKWGLDVFIHVVTGFSFGASSIALFARIGGGIFTKSADIGSDFGGRKVAGIPGDHILNPGSIVDNAGDNVGNVAGMGADLFESFIGSILSAMVIGAFFVNQQEFNYGYGISAVILPLFLGGAGVIASMAGSFIVRIKETQMPQQGLNRGGLFSSGIFLVLSFFIIYFMLPLNWEYDQKQYSSLFLFFCVITGIVAGLLTGYSTEYFTSGRHIPVRNIVRQSFNGPATNIIAGISSGMLSTSLPILIISGAIILSYHLSGFYGIAIAAVGMLANTGMQLALNAYGPISDNARGIAEMASLPQETRHRTDKLNATGNTIAAVSKGLAIVSAALTSLALFSAYMEQTGISEVGIDISKPLVMAGLLIGGALPFVFSAITISAVAKTAHKVFKETKRQFDENPELRKALEFFKQKPPRYSSREKDSEIFNIQPDYKKCVRIVSNASMIEMILPASLVIIVPIIVGFAGGAEMLGGMIAGATVSGVLLALYQSNAGGAWDNAKKAIQSGVTIDGEYAGRGSEAHKSSMVGDITGDPLKGAAGPSLNILLKLIAIIALIIAPSILNVKDITKLEGKWQVDSQNSYVDFHVDHLLSTVTGRFHNIQGRLLFTDEIDDVEMDIYIETESIDAGYNYRNDYLSTPEMFNIDEYKYIKFRSTRIVKTDRGYMAKGDLTIKGISRKVEFPIEFVSQGKYKEREYAVFRGELRIDRTNFGVGPAPERNEEGLTEISEDVLLEFRLQINR